MPPLERPSGAAQSARARHATGHVAPHTHERVSHWSQLKKLKRVLAASAYIAADLAAEASYIFDFGGTVAVNSEAAARSRAGSGAQLQGAKGALECGEGVEVSSPLAITSSEGEGGGVDRWLAGGTSV